MILFLRTIWTDTFFRLNLRIWNFDIIIIYLYFFYYKFEYFINLINILLLFKIHCEIQEIGMFYKRFLIEHSFIYKNTCIMKKSVKNGNLQYYLNTIYIHSVRHVKNNVYNINKSFRNDFIFPMLFNF